MMNENVMYCQFCFGINARLLRNIMIFYKHFSCYFYKPDTIEVRLLLLHLQIQILCLMIANSQNEIHVRMKKLVQICLFN